MTNPNRPDGKRKPGRPRLGDGKQQRSTLHLNLPSDIYDAVCRIALRRGISVRAAARELIEGATSSGGNDVDSSLT